MPTDNQNDIKISSPEPQRKVTGIGNTDNTTSIARTIRREPAIVDVNDVDVGLGESVETNIRKPPRHKFGSRLWLILFQPLPSRPLVVRSY
jgi:hypothetical protein